MKNQTLKAIGGTALAILMLVTFAQMSVSAVRFRKRCETKAPQTITNWWDRGTTRLRFVIVKPARPSSAFPQW